MRAMSPRSQNDEQNLKSYRYNSPYFKTKPKSPKKQSLVKTDVEETSLPSVIDVGSSRGNSSSTLT